MSLKHRTNTSCILAAVILIGELEDEPKQVYRRQQDDLPAHVKVNAYYEYQGPGNLDNGYYIDLATKSHAPIEFVQANDSYFWVRLVYKTDGWYTFYQSKTMKEQKPWLVDRNRPTPPRLRQSGTLQPNTPYGY